MNKNELNLKSFIYGVETNINRTTMSGLWSFLLVGGSFGMDWVFVWRT